MLADRIKAGVDEYYIKCCDDIVYRDLTNNISLALQELSFVTDISVYRSQDIEFPSWNKTYFLVELVATEFNTQMDLWDTVTDATQVAISEYASFHPEYAHCIEELRGDLYTTIGELKS